MVLCIRRRFYRAEPLDDLGKSSEFMVVGLQTKVDEFQITGDLGSLPIPRETVRRQSVVWQQNSSSISSDLRRSQQGLECGDIELLQLAEAE